MACAGRLLLLLSLLPVCMAWKPKSLFLFNKRTGEACDDHSECQSRCCVPNSLNGQAFCAAKTIFLKCLRWGKPNRDACSDHAECRSHCCVTNSASSQTFCRPRGIFLQCTPWRRPNGARCGHHRECRSQCCIALSEVSRPRCVRRSGLLAQCLPLVSARPREGLPAAPEAGGPRGGPGLHTRGAPPSGRG
ncbi:leucine-rich colipase-like protein 1 [Enhydra lutris kenyoni]|uniref:Leucine-rich colipase-like protein 1 n=1 Tax=Enhydra lutris kenyoni TaxID=391180 RepID=A0A2Y9IKP8_ENHLU|nr:leucine-rich colipase-like protein 1 [Enhydra lutris kenyoni]